MKNQKEYNFKDLSFFIRKTITLNTIEIPLRVHIKNIKLNVIDEEIKINTVGDNYIFDYQYELSNKTKYYEYLFTFIDVYENIYDYGEKNFLEFQELENINNLFYCLDEKDLNTLKTEIEILIMFVIGEFRYRLYKVLRIDKDVPEIKLKNNFKMDKNVEEYLTYDNDYVLAQSGMEFSNNVFFEENTGKAFNEFSLRELEYRSAYLTIKSRMESTEDKAQAKINQDLMNDKK